MVLNIDDDVLAVELDVPSVAYAVYTSTSASSIQLARTKLLQLNGDNDLQTSFISTVQVTAAAASLYVFRLPKSAEDNEKALNLLQELIIDGAHLKNGPAIIQPGFLYPCSDECSYMASPCTTCLNPPSTSSAPPPPPTSSASRLPRRPLRDVWAKLLDAIRERVIADIVKHSLGIGRTVNRLKDGFLLSQVSSKLAGTMTEWASGWESRVKTRSLIYTHIHIQLSKETLVVRPTLTPTPFIPLANLMSKNSRPNESLQQGTPITLLPYATPAHFLSTYNGPTSALTKQFREALLGCGTTPLDAKSASYIIAWIPVENKNGEEKGLTIIYPTDLCVGYVPTPGTVHAQLRPSNPTGTAASSPTSAVPPSTSTTLNSILSTNQANGPWTPFGRSLLPTIPSLPGPLQPSPTVLHMLPPGQAVSLQSAISAPSPSTFHFGREMLSTPASYMPTPPTTTTAFLPPISSTYTTFHPVSPYVPTHPTLPPLYSSPSAVRPSGYHLRTLSRALSYGHRQQSPSDTQLPTSLPSQPDVQRLIRSALGIGGYVDAVAKDREKERERMKLGAPKSQTGDQQPSKGQVPVISQQPTPSQAPNHPNVHPFVSLSQHPSRQPQTFYPSPPDPQSSAQAYVQSGVSPSSEGGKEVEMGDDINGTDVSKSNVNEESKDEAMEDEDDLFGDSPPMITEDLPVEPTTDPPDPVVSRSVTPVIAPIVQPQVEKTEKSEPSDPWDMDINNLSNTGDGTWNMNFDDLMGNGLDMSMDMEMFGFGSSSSSGGAVTSVANSKPSMPPPPAPAATSSIASRPTASSSSILKAINFEDDITDDDYNFFDTPDGGAAPSSSFMGMPLSTAGSLDANATLFSSISASHPSAITHSVSDPFPASSGRGGMHPPPVPQHMFGFTPSPGPSSSPWASHAHPHPHYPGTPSTPGLAPDIFPLSPPEEGSGMTPLTIGVGTPQTPSMVAGAAAVARWEAGWGVQLESPFSSPERRSVSISEPVKDESAEAATRRRLSGFDPIPFAASHRESDGKYVYGKFMIPSPPLDGDPEDGPGYFSLEKAKPGEASGLSPALRGLKLQYNTKTDPRIGQVKQLRSLGVKRKRTVSTTETNTRVVTPSWVKEWEGESTRPNHPLTPAPSPPSLEDKSDDEDDDDDSDDGDYLQRSGSSSPDSDLSRPTTPAPHYLPIGPSLLSTHFHHAHLLPLSSPLKNIGASHDESHLSATGVSAAASVPTPVSPAAMMGAASEKSRNLEAAAEMVAREVVENGLWGVAWSMNLALGKGVDGNKPWVSSSMSIDALRAVGLGLELGQQEVSMRDINVVKDLFSGVKGLRGYMSLESLFDLKSSSTPPKSRTISPLDPPLISVGKGDVVIDISPTALRFWDKLGLGPKHGEKDATVFVLYEDYGEWHQQQIETWLSNLTVLYKDKNLGEMVPGVSSYCEKDGLVPLRYDSSFRKNLASFVAHLPTPRSRFIFFILVPCSAMSLSSPVLRQVFAAIKKAIKTYSEAQILFQFIPEELLLGSLDVRSPDDIGTHRLCCSVYNRILQPVERVMSRRFFEHGLRVRNFFHEPAITLSRPTGPKVTYANNAHTSLGVLDRHSFLHVGYQISHCKKWILAACVDQRGEAHDLGVWLAQPADSEKDDAFSEEMHIVTKVWEFGMQFAEKADVEWRIVFAKLGPMGPNELDAWTSQVATSLHSVRSRTPIHVSVVSVDSSSPWTLLPSRPKLSTTPSVPSLPAKPPTLNRSNSMPSKFSMKNGSSNIFMDGTMTAYALLYKSPLSSSVPPTFESIGITSNLVFDDPFTSSRDEERPHMSSLLPLTSATLIRTPHPSSSPSSPTPSRMFDIHLMHVAKSRGCTYTPMSLNPPENKSTSPDGFMYHPLLRDITHSYYSLSILSSSRMQLVGINDILPFHLGAVEAMRNALSFKASVDGGD